MLAWSSLHPHSEKNVFVIFEQQRRLPACSEQSNHLIPFNLPNGKNIWLAMHEKFKVLAY